MKVQEYSELEHRPKEISYFDCSYYCSTKILIVRYTVANPGFPREGDVNAKEGCAKAISFI